MNFIKTAFIYITCLLFFSGCSLSTREGERIGVSILPGQLKTHIEKESTEQKWHYKSYNDDVYLDISKSIAYRKRLDQSFTLLYEEKKYNIHLNDDQILNIIGIAEDPQVLSHRVLYNVAVIGGSNIIPGVSRVAMIIPPVSVINKSDLIQYSKSSYLVEKNNKWYAVMQKDVFKGFDVRYTYEYPTIQNELHLGRSFLLGYRDGTIFFKCSKSVLSKADAFPNTHTMTCGGNDIEITEISIDGIKYKYNYVVEVPFL